VSTGALPSAVVFHRFPEQVLVDRAEHLVGQLEGAYLFAIQIHYINRCHEFFRYVGANRSSRNSGTEQTAKRGYLLFFATWRFDAFNGSTVPAPLNPRRSLGGFLALLITT
jgi:hypothetical protein